MTLEVWKGPFHCRRVKDGGIRDQQEGWVPGVVAVEFQFKVIETVLDIFSLCFFFHRIFWTVLVLEPAIELLVIIHVHHHQRAHTDFSPYRRESSFKNWGSTQKISWTKVHSLLVGSLERTAFWQGVSAKYPNDQLISWVWTQLNKSTFPSHCQRFEQLHSGWISTPHTKNQMTGPGGTFLTYLLPSVKKYYSTIIFPINRFDGG